MYHNPERENRWVVVSAIQDNHLNCAAISTDQKVLWKSWMNEWATVERNMYTDNPKKLVWLVESKWLKRLSTKSHFDLVRAMLMDWEMNWNEIVELFFESDLI